jgi:hypothetical protein
MSETQSKVDPGLIVDIVGELVQVGLGLYRDIQRGDLSSWTPLSDLFSEELRARVYHEAREERMRRQVGEALDGYDGGGSDG